MEEKRNNDNSRFESDAEFRPLIRPLEGEDGIRLIPVNGCYKEFSGLSRFFIPLRRCAGLPVKASQPKL